MKRNVFGIIVILCCVLVALLLNSCTAQSSPPASSSIVAVVDSSAMLTWFDNINNPANWEDANEVRFNYPEMENEYTLQLLFCDRYYDTMEEESREWYFRELSQIKQVFHVWVK